VVVVCAIWFFFEEIKNMKPLRKFVSALKTCVFDCVVQSEYNIDNFLLMVDQWASRTLHLKTNHDTVAHTFWKHYRPHLKHPRLYWKLKKDEKKAILPYVLIVLLYWYNYECFNCLLKDVKHAKCTSTCNVIEVCPDDKSFLSKLPVKLARTGKSIRKNVKHTQNWINFENTLSFEISCTNHLPTQSLYSFVYMSCGDKGWYLLSSTERLTDDIHSINACELHTEVKSKQTEKQIVAIKELLKLFTMNQCNQQEKEINFLHLISENADQFISSYYDKDYFESNTFLEDIKSSHVAQINKYTVYGGGDQFKHHF